MCNCAQKYRLKPEYESILQGENEGGPFPEMEFELLSEVDKDPRKSLAYIKWIQQSLNKILGLKLNDDGIMGNNTRTAIRAFQKKTGFKGKWITGNVGVATEAAMIKAGAPSPPGIHTATPPPLSTCDDEADITTAFRKFLADAPVLVNSSKTIQPSLKPGIIAMMRDILLPENKIDITAFKVVSCSKIHNPLLAGMGGTAGAEINVPGNTLSLSESTWQNAADFRSTGDLYYLASFFQIVAHEKRHATLGATVQVTTAALRPGQFAMEARQAQYRVEEILAKAEEIAVGRRIYDAYTVSEPIQQLIRRHWVIIEARVNDKEFARLRALIIQQLRNRYGFPDKCDNPVTVGVVMCMETSEWYACFDRKIPRKIPAGIMVCKNSDGTHTICH